MLNKQVLTNNNNIRINILFNNIHFLVVYGLNSVYTLLGSAGFFLIRCCKASPMYDKKSPL